MKHLTFIPTAYYNHKCGWHQGIYLVTDGFQKYEYTLSYHDKIMQSNFFWDYSLPKEIQRVEAKRLKTWFLGDDDMMDKFTYSWVNLRNPGTLGIKTIRKEYKEDPEDIKKDILFIFGD